MMLSHDQSPPLGFQVRQSSVDPCWIDSPDESENNFKHLKIKLHQWFEFMQEKIGQLKSVGRLSATEFHQYGSLSYFFLSYFC